MKTERFKDADIPKYINHKIAIKSISEKLNLDPKVVNNTLKLFFNQGLRFYLSRQEPVTIVSFGKFEVNQLGTRIKGRRADLERMGHNRRMKKFMKKWRARKAQ